MKAVDGQKTRLLALLACLAFLAAGASAKPLSEQINYALYDQNLDYRIVNLSYVDDGGFMEYHDDNVSMRWKAELFLPEDGPVFGLQPINPNAIIKLTFRDIKGHFTLHGIADWEGLEKFPREKEWHVGNAGIGEKSYFVSDVNDLVVYRKHGIISFLGNTLASPPLIIDRIDGAPLMTVNVFVPKTRKILDVYRSMRTFRLGDHTFFFVRYTHMTGIIYVDETQKLLVHIGLSLIVLAIVACILKLYDRLPKFSFESRHLLMVVLLCWFLMTQLAFVAPNPNAIVYVMEGESMKYGGVSIQHYLRLITGLTNSVDALIVNDDAWCWTGIYQGDRNLYLVTRSSEKVYMRESVYHSSKPCIQESKAYFGSKLQVIPDSVDAASEIMSRYRHHYPWKATWGIARRVIYLLFLVLSFFSTAFVVLKAFEIRDLKMWVAFAVVGFLFASTVQFFNLTTAFVARMPVTYHGTSSLPLTMSAKVLPFFNQAHNIRMAILLLGALFVFVFSASIREKVSIRVFLLPLLVLGLMLAAPMTEYSTKAFIVAFACGGCGFEYKGPLDTFNSVKLYAALRGDTQLSVLVSNEDTETFERAKLLEEQGDMEGAIDLYQEYLVSYQDISNYIEAVKSLSGLYTRLARYDEAERYLRLALETDLDDGGRADLTTKLWVIYKQTNRIQEALTLQKEQADLIENEFWKSMVLTRLGSDYYEAKMYREAKQTLEGLQAYTDRRPEDVETARRILDELRKRKEAKP